ncbi:septum formation initiator family protein [Candidatus Gracilibacteria bacterium]|nr:septum formation initiator family protein [Candidatus Gracilibacteria bacterium]MCF7819382.1 septum formation initiator family protein [Candidatus Gracilibacteria bacterium]
MKKENVYTSKNILSLVGVFVIIFWLLYSLASFLHESRKIEQEIDAIRAQNEKALQEIELKKRRLQYLQTPQRIDKEAKMQMGKKQPNENVLIFIEEKLDILPTKTEQRQKEQIVREDVPIIDKWKWVFFGQK